MMRSLPAAGRSIAEARAAGVVFLGGAQLWGAFEPLDLMIFDGQASRLCRPQRLIVAAGAHERGLPFPGWTLPGVMTTGAAQTLLRSYAVLPGRRVLVAGNGPLNLQVALELARRRGGGRRRGSNSRAGRACGPPRPSPGC